MLKYAVFSLNGYILKINDNLRIAKDTVSDVMLRKVLFPKNIIYFSQNEYFENILFSYL